MSGAKIKNILKALSQVDDLSPSPRVNKLFRSLVQEATSNRESLRAMSANEIKRLQEICSKGEYNLERYWALRILKAYRPKAELARFPYLENYRALVRLEWLSFQGCQEHKTHSVLFCGGGPLPLSAIMLAAEFSIPSTVIDNDTLAARLAKKLVRKLKLSKMIKVKNDDARNFNQYVKFSAIFVAALAGTTPKLKREIFARIHRQAKEGTHVIARSSWANRKLLYRPLDPKTHASFKPVIRIDPYTDIVNSVLIFKKHGKS
jgi:nicotianamine synthase